MYSVQSFGGIVEKLKEQAPAQEQQSIMSGTKDLKTDLGFGDHDKVRNGFLSLGSSLWLSIQCPCYSARRTDPKRKGTRRIQRIE